MKALGKSTSAAAPDAGYTFEEDTLYETHRGLLRFFRRLLNPILKLFFNPNPLVDALHKQAALNREAATREAERQRLQSEWNALHYEILQRLVTDVSRVSVEMQALALRVESLTARVDFNDRKVRALDAPSSGRQQPRQVEQPAPAAQAPTPTAGGEATAPEAAAAADGSPASEGTRRRRRRRRGRRGGGAGAEGGAAIVVAGEGLAGPDTVGLNDLEDGDDDEPEAVEATSGTEREPVLAVDVVETVSTEPLVVIDEATEPVLRTAPEPSAAAPPPPPEQPTPPPDEPAPQAPEPPDPGPPDR